VSDVAASRSRWTTVSVSPQLVSTPTAAAFAPTKQLGYQGNRDAEERHDKERHSDVGADRTRAAIAPDDGGDDHYRDGHDQDPCRPVAFGYTDLFLLLFLALDGTI
jgi:hypothetical protein